MIPHGTLPLFSEQELELSSPSLQDRLRRVTWSYSRRTVLEQCPRRYYYVYYGANGRTALRDPKKAELRFLGKLQNRYERAGAILHSVIATFLRKARAGDRLLPEGLREWARRLFDRDLQYSAGGADGAVGPTGNYPPVLLREFHYRFPNALGLCEETRNRLLQALNVFAKNPAYSSFRDAAARPDALIEQRISVRGLPCKVAGRIDLAYSTEYGVTVVDWKLGNAESSGDSLQLITYALWACDYFGVKPTEVQACEARLGCGEVARHDLTEKTLAKGRMRILQDAERMAAMEGYGRAGQAEAFSACAQPSVCYLCPFQKACPEGGGFLDAGD